MSADNLADNRHGFAGEDEEEEEEVEEEEEEEGTLETSLASASSR